MSALQISFFTQAVPQFAQIRFPKCPMDVPRIAALRSQECTKAVTQNEHNSPRASSSSQFETISAKTFRKTFPKQEVGAYVGTTTVNICTGTEQKQSPGTVTVRHPRTDAALTKMKRRRILFTFSELECNAPYCRKHNVTNQGFRGRRTP